MRGLEAALDPSSDAAARPRARSRARRCACTAAIKPRSPYIPIPPAPEATASVALPAAEQAAGILAGRRNWPLTVHLHLYVEGRHLEYVSHPATELHIRSFPSGFEHVCDLALVLTPPFPPDHPSLIRSQACNRLNTVCVPLYDSLGENAIEYIINHAEAAVAFVATTKLGALAKALDKTKDTLKTIVYWGKGDAAAIKVGMEC
eukprot:365573-Chlamydomonas_euryale.AAC.3